jgi:hypothetical protein
VQALIWFLRSARRLARRAGAWEDQAEAALARLGYCHFCCKPVSECAAHSGGEHR